MDILTLLQNAFKIIKAIFNKPSEAAPVVVPPVIEVKPVYTLNFSDNVVRTIMTDPVIAKLQVIFTEKKFTAWVTSILRTPGAQLNLITRDAQDHGIIPKNKTLNMGDTMIFNGKTYPIWQVVWSTLLNKGVIINPPVSAIVLMDYIRDGVNKKGWVIPPSPHSSGKAFDIGGFNAENTIDACFALLTSVKEQVGIKDILLEPVNHCCHSDVL